MNLFRHVEAARDKRRALEALPSDTPAQIAAKQALHEDAETALAKLQALADGLIGLELRGLSGMAYQVARDEVADRLMALWANGTLTQLQQEARKDLGNRGSGASPTGRPLHWPLAFPEIMERGGFDALVGNPPFLWGNRISIRIGYAYRDWLQSLHTEARGQTDLCAHFLRRCFSNLTQHGTLGLVTTNSICETDTLHGGLIPIVSDGGTIYRASSDKRWPGDAGVRIAILHILKGTFDGDIYLDGTLVDSIRPDLTIGVQEDTPFHLRENAELGFKGVDFGGTGFILSDSELELLCSESPNECCFIWPLMNALDVTSHPSQQPTRRIVNFSGMEYEAVCKAAPSLLSIIESRVKPDRAKAKSKIHREKWWLYFWPRPELYSKMKGLKNVVVNPVVAKWITFSLLPSHAVFSNALNVFPVDDSVFCSILQSTIHTEWAMKYGSSMKTDPRYNPSDCFETFPFPLNLSGLDDIGERYYEHRQSIMQTRQEGLTKTYNRFHNPQETAADLQKLRELHVEMDEAVAVAYGWEDLKLQHGFHETKQGLRYTLSEAARREVLDRLLRLNHERYAEEVKQGLHDKKGGKRKANAKDAPDVEGFALEAGVGEVKRRGRKAK